MSDDALNAGRFYFFHEEAGTWGIREEGGHVFATALDKADALRLSAVLSEFAKRGTSVLCGW